jgi:hypothetical protein
MQWAKRAKRVLSVDIETCAARVGLKRFTQRHQFKRIFP